MSAELNSLSAFLNDPTLVAYYRMESNSNDSKGSNNGTDTAMSYSSGKFGNAADFNGSTSFIALPSLAVGSGAFTMGGWVKVASMPGSNYGLLGAASGYPGLLMNSGGFSVGKSATSPGSSVTYTVPSNTWVHIVAVVKDSTHADIYINGAFRGTSTETNAYTLGNHTVNLGCGFNVADVPLTGHLDDVFYFSRALSAWEINQIYTGFQSKELASTSLVGDANIISLYRFEGDVTDAKGTNNGTNHSAVLGSSYGKFGQGANFTSASSHYIDLGAGSTLNRSGDLTISAWVYHNQGSGTEGTIISNYDSGGAKCQYQLKLVNTAGTTKAVFNLNNTTQQAATSNAAIPANVWTHVLITRTGTTLKIYINGILDNTVTLGETAPTSGYGNTSIGRAGSYNGIYYNGSLDDVVIFNRVLTASEIQNLYLGSFPSELNSNALASDSSLKAYYRMSNGALTTDSKGSNTLSTTGTVNNVSEGKFGYGADFGSSPNTTNAMRLGNGLGVNMSSAWAITGWVKMNANPDATNRLLLDWRSTTGTARYGICRYENSSGLRLNIDASGSQVNLPFDLGIGVWHLLTLQFQSDGKIHLYVDAVDIGSVSMGTSNAGDQVGIGNAGDTGSPNLSEACVIDDVAFFSRELTEAEIQSLWIAFATTQTQTITSKARIKLSGNDKTITAKGRIKVGGVTKTVTSKARVKVLGVTKTLTALAKVLNGMQQTIQAKADIFNTNTKTVTAKARVKQPNITKTVTAKARIKQAGITKTVSAKANLMGTVNQTVTAKAKIFGANIGVILGRNNDTGILVGVRK